MFCVNLREAMKLQAEAERLVTLLGFAIRDEVKNPGGPSSAAERLKSLYTTGLGRTEVGASILQDATDPSEADTLPQLPPARVDGLRKEVLTKEQVGIGDGNTAWDAVAGPALDAVNAAFRGK